jgi:hypothetical protein
MCAEPGFKVEVNLELDGNWHVHCTMCNRWGGDIGSYSNREAAVANAEHHERRADHRPVGDEW